MRSHLLLAALVVSLAANAFFTIGLRRMAGPASAMLPETHAKPTGTSPRALAWSGLQADHPEDAMARLRAGGVSDPEIRSILSALLDQKAIARRKELEGPAPAYWKYLSPPGPLEVDPQARAELRRMSSENERLLDRLLGPGPRRFGELTDVAGDMVRYAGLSENKVGQMRQLDIDYRELGAGVRAAMFGISLPEDREMQRFLEQEKEKDMRALLTADEYELYQLRNSQTASTLRSNLATFDPTEEEFRQIFRLRQDYEQRYDFIRYPLTADPAKSGWAEAEKRMNDAIQAALGPERGAVYTRESDSEYRATGKLVAQLGLAPDGAVPIWTMAKDFQGRISAVTSNAALSDREKAENISSLLQEASAKLSDRLGGAQGLDAYKRSTGGTWMSYAEAQRARLVRN